MSSEKTTDDNALVALAKQLYDISRKHLQPDTIGVYGMYDSILRDVLDMIVAELKSKNIAITGFKNFVIARRRTIGFSEESLKFMSINKVSYDEIFTQVCETPYLKNRIAVTELYVNLMINADYARLDNMFCILSGTKTSGALNNYDFHPIANAMRGGDSAVFDRFNTFVTECNHMDTGNLNLL